MLEYSSKGESVELDGILYTPDMVLGKEKD